ncbi:MAG: efflux RND transporter periplasmic adaptor subunit, partial [Acidobacteria bacterium]|nr:efflux RND transporter periplasmic adaptor subunit [Acidobacteriota bacterium]
EQVQARLENAKAAAARVKGLFERGIAAMKEVEDAERDLRDAEAALSRAQSASRAAETLAGRAEARARFAGIIAKRWHNPGDLVEPGQSDPILRVIDPSRLEVAAAVPVDAVTRIVVGGAARVIDPGGGAPTPATIVARPASVDPVSATAGVRLALPRTASFAAGLPVQVEILGREHRNAIVVPSAAILHEGGKSVVVIVGPDGKAHRREVEVGVVARDVVEIKTGVADNDRVIVRGHNGLPDNAAVTIGS